MRILFWFFYSRSMENPLKNYRLGRTLGHGAFGKVKIAEHIRTGHKVAVKILNRRKIRSTDMEEKVKREIKICRLFVHPHIIRLYEVIETPADIYVVMEYVKSGELFDYIVEKGRLQEDEARKLFQQVICGVEYCHNHMVVHRDLKPENLLLDTGGNVKIADFGLSNVMRDGHFLRTSCGSPNYAAPEVVSGKLYAGPEIDVWSCGVILYALLCGTLPFDDENIPNLFKKIKSGAYTLPSHLSTGVKDLLPRMLIVDPLKRITVPEIRQHYWFNMHLPRYLAGPLPNAMQHIKKLDEEIVQEVIRMGFERNHLIESLQNRMQNDATVAYYLKLDSQPPVSIGYLGAEFQEPMEAGHGGVYVGARSHASPRSVISQETPKKWSAGFQCRAPPRDAMNQVLRALQELNIRWKRIGHYNIKCIFLHNLPNADTSMTDDLSSNNQLPANEPFGDSSSLSSPAVVKFELQVSYLSVYLHHFLSIICSCLPIGHNDYLKKIISG
ncbi:hypothetical protein Leryth_014262 [Lithospermum erythrorhizon]|nr:hypothetical protein Leryth_014262 [Lithospermum erythrorhizon]